MSTDSARILVVDDEPHICKLICSWMTRRGMKCLWATDAGEAMRLLSAEPVSVLVTDVCLGEATGLDLLAYANEHTPGCRSILISGQCEVEALSRALSLGAYDFLLKPLDMLQLAETIEKAAEIGEGRLALRLPHRAARAMQLEAQLRQASLDSIGALVHAVEAKDPYTRQHSEQVAHYAVKLAEYINDPVLDIDSIRIASLLHDIGKIGVPDRVLTKSGQLTNEEFGHIRCHPILGSDILANIPLFAAEALLVRFHHERWDGKGYPDGLTAEEVPVGGRIIHLADAMDAMLMARTYKQAYPLERMLDELRAGAGTQFDPYLATIAIQWCHDCTSDLIISPPVEQDAPVADTVSLVRMENRS